LELQKLVCLVAALPLAQPRLILRGLSLCLPVFQKFTLLAKALQEIPEIRVTRETLVVLVLGVAVALLVILMPPVAGVGVGVGAVVEHLQDFQLWAAAQQGHTQL
jgi:hypothetical protein